MARRKAKMGPFSGSNTGPMSPTSSAQGVKTKAVGSTAPGRPGKKHMRGRKRRG